MKNYTRPPTKCLPPNDPADNWAIQKPLPWPFNNQATVTLIRDEESVRQRTDSPSRSEEAANV